MLFTSRKRLRIYDMEVEEEEDEEMFNSSGPLTETTDNNPMYWGNNRYQEHFTVICTICKKSWGGGGEFWHLRKQEA